MAQAVLRVFQRLGDYKHKQRNRMKFMIRELGWTRWRRGIRARADPVPPEWRGARRSRSIRRPSSRRPTGRKEASPAVGQIASRGGGARSVSGPGHRADHRAAPAGRRRGVRALARRRTCGPQKQFGYLIAIVTVPLGDLTSAQMRVLGELARAYGDGTVRVTPDQNLVLPLGQRLRRASAVSASGGGRPGRWPRPARSRTW